MEELEVRRWLREAKREYEELEKICKDDPNQQNRFNLTLAQWEVKFAEAKLKNMKKRDTS
ncbi:hypothetical protein [Desulforamulus aquiferis]|uniref:Uncharacterized protein n=1 Tax=Desulforamulus aquiferis TaxID=1397668 RepID=A0AAW7ZD02_9FIRM|nr:hypothetical protein [Desulforamulus aquiferis]MDO7787135.1 hypothetical protein [Desulforamulus aquiferis]